MEGSKFIVLTGRTGAKLAIRAKDIVALEESDKKDYTYIYSTNVEVVKPDSKITTYYVKQTIDEILDRL
jgi:hypothetical protein